MDSKKIIIVVLVVVLMAAGYFAYAKGLVPKIEAQKKQDEAEAEVMEIEEKKTNLIDSLTEAQKQDAYALAYDIYEDMKGWNLHKMLLYKKLNEASSAYLLYFVTVAYPRYDTIPFVDRIKKQKWSSVSPASKKAGLDDAAAERLIQTIKYKVENFKL